MSFKLQAFKVRTAFRFRFFFPMASRPAPKGKRQQSKSLVRGIQNGHIV
jgi:hypothetical protein